MKNLPVGTTVDKIVAKDRFDAAVRDNTFIKRITWASKLAPTTLNAAASANPVEVEIFRVELRDDPTAAGLEKILKSIQSKIPYPILFEIAMPDGSERAAIFYGERLFVGKIPDALSGANIKQIYENLVRAVAGESLTKMLGAKLDDQIENLAAYEKLAKTVDALNRRYAREKQLNLRQNIARERYKVEQNMLKLEKKKEGQ
jgi:hypothetical protein